MISHFQKAAKGFFKKTFCGSGFLILIVAFQNCAGGGAEGTTVFLEAASQDTAAPDEWGVNLFPSGNFEGSLDSIHFLNESARMTSEQARMIVTPGTGQYGTKGARLHKTFISVQQSQLQKLQPNKRYRISVATRLVSFDATHNLFPRVHFIGHKRDASGQVTPLFPEFFPEVKNTAWQTYSVTFTTPALAAGESFVTFFEYVTMIDTNNVVDVDDFRIDELN